MVTLTLMAFAGLALTTFAHACMLPRGATLPYRMLMVCTALFACIALLSYAWTRPIAATLIVGTIYSSPILLLLSFWKSLRTPRAWILVFIPALLAGVYAQYHVQEITIRTENHNIPQWQGKRIAVLADTHFETAAEMDRMVALTMAQHPDAIFFLGDFANNMDLLSHPFQFPVPAFAVLGNHDDSHTERYLKANHWNVLRNNSVPLFGEKVWGFDLFAIPSDVADTDVVLCHYLPKRYVCGALVLMGHIHGGQFYPFSYLLHSNYTFLEGWYQVGKHAVFSHVGSGTSRLRGRIGTDSTILLLQ